MLDLQGSLQEQGLHSMFEYDWAQVFQTSLFDKPLNLIIKSLQTSPQYYHPHPSIRTCAYTPSPPHHRKTQDHYHELLCCSHFSSHLMRHIIVCNARWPRNCTSVKTFENGFETSFKNQCKIGHVKGGGRSQYFLDCEP